MTCGMTTSGSFSEICQQQVLGVQNRANDIHTRLRFQQPLQFSASNGGGRADQHAQPFLLRVMVSSLAHRTDSIARHPYGRCRSPSVTSHSVKFPPRTICSLNAAPVRFSESSWLSWRTPCTGFPSALIVTSPRLMPVCSAGESGRVARFNRADVDDSSARTHPSDCSLRHQEGSPDIHRRTGDRTEARSSPGTMQEKQRLHY